MDSFRLTIAIASIYKCVIKQINNKAEYLNANLDEEIYIQIPIGDKNFNCKNLGYYERTFYGHK